MSMIDRFMENAEWAVAGLVGALVAAPFHEDLKTVRGRFVFIISGTACAYFTTPLAVSYYSINPGLAGGVGFLLGAFGGSLLSATLRTLNSLNAVEAVKEVLKARLSGNKTGDDL